MALASKWQFSFDQWRQNGGPLDHNGSPPPFVKHYCLAETIERYRIDVVVETGTAMGHTTRMLARAVPCVHSIEANLSLFEVARKNLEPYPNVILHLGDSAEHLPAILQLCSGQRVMIWLDAHYSGPHTARMGRDTPVLAELEAIAAVDHRHFAVLIDDARLFNGTGDYPTVSELEAFRAAKMPVHKPVTVSYDQIYLVPEHV